MIDNHQIPNGWGVLPVLFSSSGFSVSSYSLFVCIALIAAIWIYFREAKRIKQNDDNSFFILLAAVFGGVLGAKIPIWFLNWRQIVDGGFDLESVLSGRTIVGGIIGGTLAVIITRKILNIRERRGNVFVPSLGMALFFGRIGCFLQGCCYGVATNLPWGVNFGDGVRRHPTQLYEAIFGLMVFIVSIKMDKTKIRAGLLFKLFIIGYFTFRFLVEFVRYEPRLYLGLTMAQVVCAVIVIYNIIEETIIYRKLKLNKEKNKEENGSNS